MLVPLSIGEEVINSGVTDSTLLFDAIQTENNTVF